MSLEYWNQKDHERLAQAKTYADLSVVARDIASRMPPPVGEVCGPISTGGAGSIEKNIKRFEKAIAKLQARGVAIFDQMPFEEPMQEMKHRREQNGLSGYDKAVLYEFYLPIFESGFIHTLYFLPDWQSSKGAQWEHKQAERLGLAIVYL